MIGTRLLRGADVFRGDGLEPSREEVLRRAAAAKATEMDTMKLNPAMAPRPVNGWTPLEAGSVFFTLRSGGSMQDATDAVNALGGRERKLTAVKEFVGTFRDIFTRKPGGPSRPLTPKEMAEIRALYASGLSVRKIADKLHLGRERLARALGIAGKERKP